MCALGERLLRVSKPAREVLETRFPHEGEEILFISLNARLVKRVYLQETAAHSTHDLKHCHKVPQTIRVETRELKAYAWNSTFGVSNTRSFHSSTVDLT